MFGNMKSQRFAVMLLVCMLLSMVAVGIVHADTSIVDDYPGLKPLVDFVGEENLSVLHLVGFKASNRSMHELGFERGDPSVLALTDAGYPVIETGAGFPDTYYTTNEAIDGLSATSGCILGRGNLILVHRSIYDPLWFAFFDKNTGECVYFEVDRDILKTYLDAEAAGAADYTAFMNLSPATLFSKISKANIKPADLIEATNAEAWHHHFTEEVFGGNEFSILTISAVWDKGISYEFVKAAEFHNHICPGLTSGYFIAQYLDENFPLEGKDECYIVWAVPPWCKDDAFQLIFDATVGKRHMAVMYIPKDVQEQIYPEYPNIAGIFIKFNEGTGQAQAMGLGWDWGKARSDCGVSGADFSDFSTYKWWWARLRSNVLLMDHEPEEYVSTLKVVDLGNQVSVKKMMAKWMAVGSNPLVELGLMPKPEPTIVEVVPTWTYVTIGVLVAIIVVMSAYVAKLRKAKSKSKNKI